MAEQVGIMQNTMKISILIPSYNMGWCIERAVKSCLTQTFLPLEIIVIDDASSDDTTAVMSRLSKISPKIHYIKLPQNKGQTEALKIGVEHSRGNWLVFLDADDELLPNSLKHRVNKIRTLKHPGHVGVVYGHVYYQDHGKNILVKNPLFNGNVLHFVTRELSLCQQIVLMVRKDIYQTIPSSGSRMIACEDDDLIIRLAHTTEFSSIDEPVAIIHPHDSPTRISNDILRVAIGTKQLLDRYHNDIYLNHGYIWLLLWRLRVFRRFVEAYGQLTSYTVVKIFFKLLYFPLQWIVTHTFAIHWL